MLGSKWATPASRVSKVSATTANGSRAFYREQVKTSISEEYKRFGRLVRRLEWKLPYLANSFHQAMLPPTPTMLDAETMFKLDFFEYYTLLERALIHLLRVYRIEVPRDAVVRSRPDRHLSASGVTASRYARDCGGKKESDALHHATSARNRDVSSSLSILGPSNYASPYAHRFHANTIEAFHDAANPLSRILGTPEMTIHLRNAKELRNRWKDADEKAEANQHERLLSDYDLDAMLRSILEALMSAKDMAGQTAAAAVSSGQDSVDVDVEMGMDGEEEGEEEEEAAAWETMQDTMESMDWEPM